MRAPLGLVVLLAACASPSATVAITTGGESDALTRNPAVTSVLVELVDRAGGRQTLRSTNSATTIDLGNPSQTVVGSIQLTGSGATGPVVFGAVPFAELGALNGSTIPLFVQRKGEFARMPTDATAQTDQFSRADPLLARTPRGIYMAGGTLSGSSDIPAVAAYDLLFMQGATATLPAFSGVKSFALVQLSQATSAGDIALVWLFDSTSATPLGLPTAGKYTPPTPTTFAWKDLAGGATVTGDDGSAYVVGGSRTDAPSNVVLLLPPSNNNQSGTTAPRQGAAVAWAPKRGVFVYGGNVDSSLAAEIVTTTAVSHTVNYASDSRQGLAAVAFDANTMLLAGDPATPPQKVDLTCTALTCPLAAWGALVPALSSPSLFAVGNSTFVIVGEDPTRGTRVFELTAGLTTELQLKIARQHARAVQTETGAVVIVGGGSNVLESFVP